MTIFVGAMMPMIAVLSMFNTLICRWTRYLASLLLGVMTAIILLQIISRYIFGDAFSWAEEVAKIMMVWIAFLIGPWALRRSRHVSINLFVDALPRALQLVLRIVLNAVVLVVLTLFIEEAYRFFENGMLTTAATMPVRMHWFYAVVPFGFVMLFLVAAELLLRDLAALLDPAGDYSVPVGLWQPKDIAG